MDALSFHFVRVVCLGNRPSAAAVLLLFKHAGNVLVLLPLHFELFYPALTLLLLCCKPLLQNFDCGLTAGQSGVKVLALLLACCKKHIIHYILCFWVTFQSAEKERTCRWRYFWTFFFIRVAGGVVVVVVVVLWGRESLQKQQLSFGNISRREYKKYKYSLCHSLILASKHVKSSKERYLLGQKHNLHICRTLNQQLNWERTLKILAVIHVSDFFILAPPQNKQNCCFLCSFCRLY